MPLEDAGMDEAALPPGDGLAFKVVRSKRNSTQCPGAVQLSSRLGFHALLFSLGDQHAGQSLAGKMRVGEIAAVLTGAWFARSRSASWAGRG
jgi:hypothetical protein